MDAFSSARLPAVTRPFAKRATGTLSPTKPEHLFPFIYIHITEHTFAFQWINSGNRRKKEAKRNNHRASREAVESEQEKTKRQ
jgi:hypothetical protein